MAGHVFIYALPTMKMVGFKHNASISESQENGGIQTDVVV